MKNLTTGVDDKLSEIQTKLQANREKMIEIQNGLKDEIKLLGDALKELEKKEDVLEESENFKKLSEQIRSGVQNINTQIEEINKQMVDNNELETAIADASKQMRTAQDEKSKAFDGEIASLREHNQKSDSRHRAVIDIIDGLKAKVDYLSRILILEATIDHGMSIMYDARDYVSYPTRKPLERIKRDAFLEAFTFVTNPLIKSEEYATEYPGGGKRFIGVIIVKPGRYIVEADLTYTVTNTDIDIETFSVFNIGYEESFANPKNRKW